MVSTIEAPKTVEWGGYTWHKTRENYYIRRCKYKTIRLHREICRKAHGDFPDDWDVHHIDGNRLNNHPSNLVALSKSDHRKKHPPACKEYTADCLQCEAKFTYRVWLPRAVAFCSLKCNEIWRRNAFKPQLASCKMCGEEFTQVRNAHFFCSKTCGSKHSYMHQKTPTSRRIRCDACTKWFITKRSNGRFCSRECAYVYHWVTKERRTLKELSLR